MFLFLSFLGKQMDKLLMGRPSIIISTTDICGNSDRHQLFRLSIFKLKKKTFAGN